MSIEPAPIEDWQPWTPAELAARLAGVDAPWCVAGGWAIDLHLGRATRVHEDLEFATQRPFDRVLRAALGELAHFSPSEHVLYHMPLDAERPPESHQTWMLDRVERMWRVDLMLEPGDADTWVYRRDESITAPRAFMERRTADGIPYLGPHGALFYKSKAPRPKDEADFAVCAPTLDADERAWLVETIERAHPGHHWLERLRQPE